MTTEKEPTLTTFEFDEAFQKKIAALTIRDPLFHQQTDGLIVPDYFQNPVDGAIVAIIQDHYKTYKTIPDGSTLTTVIIDAHKAGKIRKDLVPEIKGRLGLLMGMKISDRSFVVDKVSDFAKYVAMELAIMKSVELLEKKDHAGIQKLIQAAGNVGAQDGSGDYDYFKEIESRTELRVAKAAGTIRPSGITTGFPDMDKHLYHEGWGRKELSALMARAKFGKSMGLGEFGKSASMAGYNVFIGSCEVSREIYAERLDANFSDIMMKLMKDSPFEVKRKVQEAEKRAGALKIRDYASGSLKPSQLRRTLEWYRGEGIIFDMIIVDYADIMCPEHFTGEMREDSKSIWIDLRGIAWEQNAAVLTATQTNRDGAKAMTAKATDVAEDYNKIRIADLVISGNATEPEIASGEARLHFAASRNQKEVTMTIRQEREKMKFLTKVLSVA